MHLIYFLAALGVSTLLTKAIRSLMIRLDVVDRPKIARKIHKKAVALGGGLSIYVSFFLIVGLAYLVFGHLGTDVRPRVLIGAAIGGAILMVGGFLDDKYTLTPKKQIVFPVLASLVAITFGLGLESVTNPTGGMIQLNQLRIPIEGIGSWVVLADTIVFFWLMGMMFTTKFLDGLDGLVAGMVTIGAGMVYIVSQQPQWYQPEVGLVALIFAGSTLGFLFWNRHPASIFLGEGGSLFTGYMLGVLALLSGSKIATTLLVMGIPILDVARVIVTRIFKKRPVFAGDSEHLHFRLLHSGLSQRQAVLLFYAISLIFGLSTLFLQSRQKIWALSFLLILMILIGLWFSRKEDKSYE